ncbi:MAG: GTP 3',8-cyclase MoaA [Saprospiraceae bacterium]|nr:GTP 3',8-cyclase MoaA [Saprospiraceae bacterium]
MLFDKFNRIHDYLRISLTDNCNFRCTYCMPEEKIQCLPNHKLMSSGEIIEIADVFVKLGINKIRLTGGEPLLRKDFGEIFEGLSSLPVKMTITTNAFWLNRYIDLFKKTGLKSLNISIDSLDREKFFSITKRDHFETVWSNILLMIEHGFDVKLNIVLMKNVNDDEINNFILLTKDLPVHVRFIEFMPFDKNKWDRNKVISFTDVFDNIYRDFDIIKLHDEKHDTSKKFKVTGHQGTFAFITTMSQPFCVDCNRLRLTADGKIKNCLFGKDELDLLLAFREGQDIKNIITESVASKHFKMGGQFESGYLETSADDVINRSMIKIGG